MSKEFKRMQQLAGLLTEIKIVGVQQLFRPVDTRGHNFVHNWTGTHEFMAPNGEIIRGFPQSRDDYNYVEPIGNNPLIFGIVTSSSGEAYPENIEAIKQMKTYLDKHRIPYNGDEFADAGDIEYYIVVDLDELKRKNLINDK